MSRGQNYLGIARKAGAIELGEEKTGTAVRAGKAKLVILASDASPNAVKRAEGFSFGRSVLLLTVPLTKEEISGATGKNGCSMAAFTDLGLAANFASALAQEQGGDYSAAAAELQLRLERAVRRKSGPRTQADSSKQGKRRNSV